MAASPLLSFRCYDELGAEIRKAASRHELSVSEWVRGVIEEALVRGDCEQALDEGKKEPGFDFTLEP